ncbi:indole-3-glycerol-phosphate synthase [Betaproteobacteria bacterium GR16-43]|nr:indole-3-glycerol-phosphate synthase [Betaproteobacteria bacterium GR16-43]
MSSDILRRILATKRVEIEAGRAARPMERIERESREASPPRGFEAAIRRDAQRGAAVIAEIKRASPSRGTIRADFDVTAIARSYAANGASCLSVLTDREYFGGSPADLVEARQACALPVIRKDFVIDPWQVYESRAMGADCILLIVGAVPPADLLALERLAKSLGMDVLVESHDAAELEVALQLQTPLQGINNRDLRTFTSRLETTLDLLPRIPSGRIVVTESGIATPDDVAAMVSKGVSAYLVGSAFMAAPDPGAELQRLFSGVRKG